MYMRCNIENSSIAIEMLENYLKIIYHFGCTNNICANSKKFYERMTGGNL